MPTTTAAPLRIGYALSSEEHSPNDLIEHAKLAERAGFDFLMDHRPLPSVARRQGHSPFVWSVLGALAARGHSRWAPASPAPSGVSTRRCSPRRPLPSIDAARAVRFGVGTGEALNEHIPGDVWPHQSCARDARGGHRPHPRAVEG